jgi:hypothetical protein
VRNRRHAPGAARVGAEVNPGNLPAQSAVFVVVVGSGLALVAADFTAGNTRRSLIETATVVLSVGVWDGSHRSRRRRVEVGTFTQRLSGAVGRADWRRLVHAVLSWRRWLLFWDGVGRGGGDGGGLASEVDDGVFGETSARAAGLATRAEIPVTAETVCLVWGLLLGFRRP